MDNRFSLIAAVAGGVITYFVTWLITNGAPWAGVFVFLAFLLLFKFNVSAMIGSVLVDLFFIYLERGQQAELNIILVILAVGIILELLMPVNPPTNLNIPLLTLVALGATLANYFFLYSYITTNPAPPIAPVVAEDSTQLYNQMFPNYTRPLIDFLMDLFKYEAIMGANLVMGHSPTLDFDSWTWRLRTINGFAVFFLIILALNPITWAHTAVSLVAEKFNPLSLPRIILRTFSFFYRLSSNSCLYEVGVLFFGFIGLVACAYYESYYRYNPQQDPLPLEVIAWIALALFTYHTVRRALYIAVDYSP